MKPAHYTEQLMRPCPFLVTLTGPRDVLDDSSPFADKENEVQLGCWEAGSVVERLHGVWEALGSSLSTTRARTHARARRDTKTERNGRCLGPALGIEADSKQKRHSALELEEAPPLCL